MRDPRLENRMTSWFRDMVSRYDWLSIRFEYSETRETYLVSYSPAEEIELSDAFIRESMAFEDKLNLDYGDEAPLFCDDEKYFKLSAGAETIKYYDYIKVEEEDKKIDVLDVEGEITFNNEDLNATYFLSHKTQEEHPIYANAA